jgi:SAM-dependent methyltransferase
LAQALHERGHHGPYTGVDYSAQLLAWAQEHNSHPQARFIQLDLSQPGWTASFERTFDWIAALGVVHHIPGSERRQQWARQLRPLLKVDGRILISVWNFPAESRYWDRVLPWARLDLSQDEVDPGDTLLDWRRGGHGLRYLHHFEHDELAALAAAAGCVVVKQAEAGGESGQLNRLQLWQTQPPSQ